MKLTCPACSVVFPVEAALTDAQAREAVAAALALPASLGDRLLRYLGLFRSQSRALSWDRAARLLSELIEPIKAGRVERQGRTWVVTPVMWEIALDDLLGKREKLQLPLKSHGYLLEIVAGLASKAEGRAESAAIESAKGPYRPLNQVPPVNADPAVREAALAALKKQLKGGTPQ